MKRPFIVTLTVALVAIVVPALPLLAETPEAAAEHAAREWLALVDAGKYGASWDAAAQVFRAAVTRAQWEEQVKKTRAPLGRVVSRKLEKAQFIKDPPKSPPGDYVGIEYASTLGHTKVVETVVPMRDPDGQWRVSGYFVRPAP